MEYKYMKLANTDQLQKDLEELEGISKRLNEFLHARPSEDDIRERVDKLLDFKITEVFTTLQSDLGIKYGNIAPEQVVRLDKNKDKLTDIITEVLMCDIESTDRN